MKDKMNKIHNIDCLEFMKQVPDGYFEHIYIDPPYFEVKGEFDFIFGSFEEYLKWMEVLANEFKRVLSENGSLFIWGNSKKIAYKQIIFDKYFNLENSLVWRKPDSIQYQYYSPDIARSFNTHNERCLFYSNSLESTQNHFSEYFKKECIEYFGTVSEFKKFIISDLKMDSAMANRWFEGNCIIQEKHYNEIRNKSGNMILKKEYEDLRKEYEEQRRPFFNSAKLEDVITFSQESNISRYYKHPTQKSLKMSIELLRAVTNKNTKVFIPFVGSGTEAVACQSLGLEWCGCELEADYVAIANKRLEKVQGSLF